MFNYKILKNDIKKNCLIIKYLKNDIKKNCLIKNI